MTGKTLRRTGAILLAAALCASCAGIRPRYVTDPETAAVLSAPAASFPVARFAVLSDPHLFQTLGTAGKAFNEYLAESEEILEAAVQKVIDMHPQFLLVTGDLTKDGERRDHELFVKYLSELRGRGIPAYVVPGNHDILNPGAFRYNGSGALRVPNVSPEEFAELYRDSGYGNALSRDPASLSYVARPVTGLRLLALDACEADNDVSIDLSTGTWQAVK